MAWSVDANLFFHGGFDSDSPNVPTNSIMKVDLLKLVEGTTSFKDKLTAFFGAYSPTNLSSSTASINNRSDTPTMTSSMRSNSANSTERIRIAKAEVVVQEGEKPWLLALNEVIDEK